MAKGALYWRLKDEKTGKWTYKKVNICEEVDLPGGYTKYIVDTDLQGEV
jgi:hypothetical protein